MAAGAPVDPRTTLSGPIDKARAAAPLAAVAVEAPSADVSAVGNGVVQVENVVNGTTTVRVTLARPTSLPTNTCLGTLPHEAAANDKLLAPRGPLTETPVRLLDTSILIPPDLRVRPPRVPPQLWTPRD